jgi:carbon storage regulator
VLVLRRRAGETILVGGEVEIEVLEISRSRVKLGVRAPGHISVTRKEMVGVCRENQLASELIARPAHEGVGGILQLLNRPGQEPVVSDQTGAPESLAKVGSTNPEPGRYVTSERYSGYRRDRENPHPAR